MLQEEMQRQFDPHGEDFTLEKIIEYGFDQYSEQIHDISSAATKELAIEQVKTKLNQLWHVNVLLIFT